jgi:hypothetical protein
MTRNADHFGRVVFLHGAQVSQILIRDLRNGKRSDVQFGSLDQFEQPNPVDLHTPLYRPGSVLFGVRLLVNSRGELYQEALRTAGD